MVRNPKTRRVLRNPEKFIAKLQAQLECALRDRAYWHKAYNESGGSVILNGGGQREIGCGVSTCLINLKVGDVVAEIGKVTSISASKCSVGNEESRLTYKQIQTRKMPSDFIP